MTLRSQADHSANEQLIRAVRAGAAGRIHAAEGLIAAYRCYAEALRRRPADQDARRRFRDSKAALHSMLQRRLSS